MYVANYVATAGIYTHILGISICDLITAGCQPLPQHFVSKHVVARTATWPKRRRNFRVSMLKLVRAVCARLACFFEETQQGNSTGTVFCLTNTESRLLSHRIHDITATRDSQQTKLASEENGHAIYGMRC